MVGLQIFVQVNCGIYHFFGSPIMIARASRKLAESPRRRQEGSANWRRARAVGRRAQKVCGKLAPTAGGFRKFAEGSRRRQEGLENLRKARADGRRV